MIGNPNTDIENIQSGHRDGIWHWKMHYFNNEKQETTPDGQNRTTKSKKKIRTLGEKETYIYLGILEADTIKQMEMKEKIKKGISREWVTQNQTI